MIGTRQFAIIRFVIVAVLTATFGTISSTPALAGDTSSVPVAVDDQYELYSFMDKQMLPALANDVASEGGGSLTYYDVSETTSQYQDTSVKITDTGQMQVSIAPFDQGTTISWTYRVQDETGQISEPATVQLYIKPVKVITARRTDHGRRATFNNKNEFDVLIRIDWSRAYFGKKENKLFTLPAYSKKSVRMHKRPVWYLAKALPWRKVFTVDDV